MMKIEIITNNDAHNSTLSLIKRELKQSRNAVFICAFFKSSGFSLIREEVEKLLCNGGRLTIVTGTDFYISDLDFLYAIDKKESINCSIYLDKETTFHPKVYMFEKKERLSFIIGSSNLTEGGLNKNVEINVFVEGEKCHEALEKIRRIVIEIQSKSQPITYSLLEKYRNVQNLNKTINKEVYDSAERQELFQLLESLLKQPKEIDHNPLIDKATPREYFRRIILNSLLESDGEATLKIFYSRIEENVTFNNFDLELVDKYEPKWKKTCRFTLQDLKREGYIEKGSSRGSWKLTETGYKLVENEARLKFP